MEQILDLFTGFGSHDLTISTILIIATVLAALLLKLFFEKHL